MRRHPLPTFFLLAFLLPWAVWGTTLAQDAGWLAWHVPPSLAFWIGLPIATFGTAGLTGGWTDVKDLLLRMIRVRVPGWTWLIALVGVPALAWVVVAGSAALGRPASVGSELPVGGLAGALLLNAWMFLLTEEVAWRGFALPRLQQRMRPLVADMLLGGIWALWHLPLFFVDGSFQSRVPFAGFVLSTVAISVLIGWLYDRARGSVLVVAIFHATTDVAIAFSGVMTSGAGIFWAFVALQCAVGVLVAVARLREGGMLQAAPVGPLSAPSRARRRRG